MSIQIRLKSTVTAPQLACLFHTLNDAMYWKVHKKYNVHMRLVDIRSHPDMFNTLYTVSEIRNVGLHEYGIAYLNTPREYLYTKHNSQGSLVSQTFTYMVWAVNMKDYEVVK